MDHGAGETLADQRIEEVRDGKVGDKMKRLTATRMLRSKIALTLMTSSIAFLVMIILLKYGMLASREENVENNDLDDTYGHWSYVRCPLDFPVNLGGFDTNDENEEDQDFGRDINRLDYFRIAPFDPLHGDDSNISGIANGGSVTHQVEISSDNGSGAGEASTSGIVVSQTFNHESASTVGIPAITVQALEEKMAKYEEEHKRREEEFQTQLEAERKQRADMEARQQQTVAQLAQQTKLLEQIFTFMRQYLSGNPPPPPQ